MEAGIPTSGGFTMKTLLIIAGYFMALFISAESQSEPTSLVSILNIARYQNTDCLAENGLTGICLTDGDCSRRNGAKIGNCANGYAVCCLERFTCGNVTSKNETVFVNPSYPFNSENGTDTCQVTVGNPNGVCQLRLDFLEFSLGQPDDNGQCTSDSFMVRSMVGETLPILCGENGGQHMYVDLGSSSTNPVVLSVVSNSYKTTRRWQIKITMVKCNSLDMAPSGCLQYHRKPSEFVRSFNWGPKRENHVRYLSNLRYTVCTRMEENFCSIKWTTETPESFSWGMPASRGSQGRDCNDDDFIGISQGSPDGLVIGEDRFCGTKLLQDNVIISHAKPFFLSVVSNKNSTLNRKHSQYGFSLRYTQLPCMI
ncbi:uncharacterized protein LOC143256672 isoform X1 [Tachypleus tridentatus]|uniref:uncharacterized protein LOC143256672 isoform X1 n=2 Tax=Tachypleus tridentatus TaxID=6853 RepID=UPI003FD47E39